MPSLALGPWPEGQDAYHTADHAIFQPNRKRAERLAEAIDVNLDDEGRVFSRAGTALLSPGPGVAIHSGAGLLLYQLGGTINSITNGHGATVELVSGLSPYRRVAFHSHADKVWWTNGVERGVISAIGASHWGLDVPRAPILHPQAGPLGAGTYQVVCTLQDSLGAISGAGTASSITLPAGGSILVALPGPIDGNATHVDIYASPADGLGLMWQKRVPLAALPVTLDTARKTKRPLMTQFRGPPPEGVEGIFSYLGWLMLWRGGELFRSSGISHHLFSAIQSETLPDRTLGAAGLEGGFWRVTENGAWFTRGAEPASWRTEKKDFVEYARGQFVVSGELLPFLETSSHVALFVSEHGLMAGLSSGAMVRVTPDQLPLNVTGKRASIALRELNGLRQVVFTLSPDF